MMNGTENCRRYRNHCRWRHSYSVLFLLLNATNSCWVLKKKNKIKKILLEIGVELTSSGNHGVTKGIWNVLLYECNVSNDSGDTAPSIVNTPRANWLQTGMRWRKQANERTHIQFRCIHLLLLLLLLRVNEKKFRLNEKSMQFERKI